MRNRYGNITVLALWLIAGGVAKAGVGDVGEIAVMEADGDILFFAQDNMMPPNDCPLPSVSMTQMAQKFYLTHGDDYQFLAMFTNFDILLNPNENCNEQFFAFHRGVSNAVEGIGRDIFDNTADFGSAGALESVLNMNTLDGLPVDPTERIRSNNDSVLSLLGQEAGHRWGAYVQFDDDPGAGVNASDELLGRALQHWSFFKHAASATSSSADPEASSLEGNYWEIDQPAPGQFLTTTVTDGFSPLDLYLMGFLPTNQVATFWYIKNPFNVMPPKTAGSSPTAGVQAEGAQTFVDVNDVIEIEGARVPNAASSPKIFRMAFILLTQQGVPVSQAHLDQIEGYRTAWEHYFDEETEFRGAVVTLLDDVVFVDAANNGAEDGSRDAPYNTVTEGRDNSLPGDTLVICGGNYPESGNLPLTFTTARKLRAVTGSVVVGD